MEKAKMNIILFLGLLVLAAAAEEETQDQIQQNENNSNYNSNKPGLGQGNQQFGGQSFTSTPLAFGNKDIIGGAPFTGFIGNVPVNPDFYASQGVVGGAVPTFQQVPRVLPGTPALAPAVQHAFPAATGILAATPAVVGGIGSHFTGLTGGVLPAFHGIQGVPAGALNGNVGNVNLPILAGTPYKILPQESITGFAPAQAVAPGTLVGVPAFAGGVLPPVNSGVFTQGILKTPTQGLTPTNINVPTYSTANTSSEPPTSVYRRS